jgi:hypothetical protein
MGIVGRRLSSDELRTIRDDPSVIADLLWRDLEDEGTEMSESELDLDKSWHGLHYLITGSPWTVGEGAGAAILGGDNIGEDNGYGPARLLSPDAVRTIAAGLGTIDVETLRSRYDPDALTRSDIYPQIWDEDDCFDSYLAPYFVELCGFYRRAAANGDAVLLRLT